MVLKILNRTLVITLVWVHKRTLVNGKRFVAGNSAIGGLGGAVDTNNIPNALIERVEVKSVGGAAVYGADAVAGVINFILKEDYEGFEFSYDYNSLLAEFEGAEEAFRSLMGFNSADGKEILFSLLEMTKHQELMKQCCHTDRITCTEQHWLVLLWSEWILSKLHFIV